MPRKSALPILFGHLPSHILHISFKCVYIFNLLTQQVHQVSSVGAGSFLILYLYYIKTGIKCQDNSYLFYFILSRGVELKWFPCVHLPSLVARDVALYVLYAPLMVFSSFSSLITLPPLFRNSSTVSLLISNLI